MTPKQLPTRASLYRRRTLRMYSWLRNASRVSWVWLNRDYRISVGGFELRVSPRDVIWFAVCRIVSHWLGMHWSLWQ